MACPHCGRRKRRIVSSSFDTRVGVVYRKSECRQCGTTYHTLEQKVGRVKLPPPERPLKVVDSRELQWNHVHYDEDGILLAAHSKRKMPQG